MLKESFRMWYRETDRSRAEGKLGLLEGKNNQIKIIKRMAYGYRNRDNFRIRILAANPGCEVTVSHLLT